MDLDCKKHYTTRRARAHGTLFLSSGYLNLATLIVMQTEPQAGIHKIGHSDVPAAPW